MKNKVRLGVVFDQVVSSGGGYCQSINALKLIKNLPKEIVDISIFVLNKESYDYIRSQKIHAQFIKLSFFHKIILNIKTNPKFEFIYLFIKIFSGFNIFEKIMLSRNVELVYFLSPSRLINDIGNLNFIYTIWDNCHRDNPEFPEIRKNLQFEERENYLKNITKAFAILTDSRLGKKNIMRRYGIDDERIYIMPFEPSKIYKIKKFKSKILKKYSKYAPFIFYPAQYWPHKNHSYIIEGIRELEKNYGVKIRAIFTGFDKGNLFYLKSYAKKLLVENRIEFMDFVTDEEISFLYKNCIAVVMPSYFGPTNIPPLEAFSNEAPLIYSDLLGMREQVKDAALFVDLDDSLSLAKAINKLMIDNNLRDKLIKNGNKIIEKNKSFDREKIILSILKRFYSKIKCWR